MHTTIISEFPLQCEWIQNQLSENGINSSQSSAEEASKRLLKLTDAVLLPQELPAEKMNELELKIEELKIPIFHSGKCPQNYPSRLLENTIFLPENLDSFELCMIIKDTIGKHFKKKYERSIKIGEMSLNRETRTLKHKDTQIHLTRKEYQLLELLITNAGQITTRRHIINYVWDSRCFVSPNTIDVYISRLRKKLRGLRSSIRTISSLGYELTLPTTH